MHDKGKNPLGLFAFTLFIVLCLGVAKSSQQSSGLVVVSSPYSVEETARRLEDRAQKMGLHFFARIDHAAEAKKVGLSLRPTVVYLIGNPKVGTLLMQRNQTVGIDLPNKIIVWEDEEKKVWLAYNDTSYLILRHGISYSDKVMKATLERLRELSYAATRS